MQQTDPQHVQTILERATRAQALSRLHHAWMLTGKNLDDLQNLSRTLGRQLLCVTNAENPIGGCDNCQACRQYDNEAHPDLFELSPDEAGAIKVDAVRSLIAAIGLRPALSPRKVVKIHRMDAMNPAAQNALLKTLEEPPEATVFIITTTRYRALLETIRSRVQRHHLQTIAPRLDDAFEDTLAQLNTDRARAYDPEQDFDEVRTWRETLNTLRTSPDLMRAFEVAQEIGVDVETFERWIQVLAAQLKLWVSDRTLDAEEHSRLWNVEHALTQFDQERAFNPNRARVCERLLILLTHRQEERTHG